MPGILSWTSFRPFACCSCPDPPPPAAMATSANHQTRPPTSSRCLPQSITTTHDFEVNNFSLLDGMGIGDWVESSVFTVGGCDWGISFYPDGSLRRNRAAYASIFLYYLGGPEGGVMAKFSFSLLDGDNKVFRTKVKSKGTGRRKVCRRHGRHTFQVDDYYGWCRFIEKSKLREMLRVSGSDCFTIRCLLTVIREDTTATDVNTIVVPPSNLHQDLSRMLKEEKGADVHFRVQDQEFPAHSNVLAARSAVFEEEFFGGINETVPLHFIGVNDMEPDVFECLLHFVYTDCTPDNCIAEEIVPVQYLLVAADRYGLGRLRLLCEEKLSRWIDVQSVARILAFAEQHQCVQLKNACLEFIASRDVLGAVMETEGFKDLIAKYPLIMKEILDKIVSARIE